MSTQHCTRFHREEHIDMTTSPTVAVLGLGAMGHAFAANLLKKGFPTRVWNRTRARAESLGRDGAVIGDSPLQTAEGADVLIVMATDGPSTEAMLLGEQGALAGLKHGAVLAQMGTIGVDATERLIETVRTQRPDVVYIDAPVSGTKGPAEKGLVLILASGDRVKGALVEPVFAAIGKEARWLGEAGAGTRMKVVVNAWLVSVMQGIAESASLAKQLGFTNEQLWGALEGGPLAAPFVKLKLDAISNQNFESQFALPMGLKDTRLALQAAGGQNLPSLRNIAEIWQRAVDAGGDKEDISVVYRYLDLA
jgi:3-hydroxyisobutyrate dehydrogenase